MKAILFFILCACMVSCSNSSPQKEPVPVVTNTSGINGDQLFKINCAQCHRPAEDFAAPALAGAQKRWSNKETLYAFVRNSQEVIKTDKYAAALFGKWNKVLMQPFPQLSDEQIDAILSYCDARAL